MRQQYDPKIREPADYAARRTAFLIDFDSRWDISNHRQTKRWDTEAHWMKYYRALKSLQATVDVLTADRDFSKYAFVVAPAYQLVDAELVKRWIVYVQNGGHLVLICRTAQKDTHGKL